MRFKKTLLCFFIFLFALLLFSFLFFIQRAFMTNFDERDHLAAGYLMKQGKLIYKDFFSHHFPLPYYWTYLFTPFWSSISPARTVSVFRLEMLVLYLIAYFAVFLGFKNNRSRIVLSLWLILLSFFFTVYHGNLVISETFVAIFISGIFFVCVPVFLSWEKYSPYHQTLLIIFASASFWTQPLLFSLFLIPLLLSKRGDFVRTILMIFFLNLLPIIYFYLKGQWFDFWEQGIWFNYKIYPQFFVDVEGLSNKNVLFGTSWQFLKNEFFLFTHFFNKHQIFQFILHLGFVCLLVKIIKQKKLVYLLSFLVILWATRSREVKIITGEPFNFGIYPFLLISSGALTFFAVDLFRRYNIGTIIIIGLTIFLSLLTSWEIIRNSFNRQYNYHVFWSQRQEIGQLIKGLTKHEEKILIYPHDVDLYYFANRQPPDRFLYWFPWIDSVSKYREERLEALSQKDIPLIFVGDLSFKGEKNYYSKFFPDLIKNYSPIKIDGKETGLWLKN